MIPEARDSPVKSIFGEGDQAEGTGEKERIDEDGRGCHS